MIQRICFVVGNSDDADKEDYITAIAATPNVIIRPNLAETFSAWCKQTSEILAMTAKREAPVSVYIYRCRGLAALDQTFKTIRRLGFSLTDVPTEVLILGGLTESMSILPDTFSGVEIKECISDGQNLSCVRYAFRTQKYHRVLPPGVSRFT